MKKTNSKICFFIIFFLFLLFFPSRYYVALNNYFSPFSFSVIIPGVLFSLILVQLFLQLFPAGKVNSTLRKSIAYIFLLLGVQLISWITNIYSQREPVDIAIHFITFFGPMTMLPIACWAVSSFKNVAKAINVFLIVVLLAVIVSVLFVVTSNLFGFISNIHLSLTRRLFLPRLGTTGLAHIITVALPLVISIYLFTKNKKYYGLCFIFVFALFFTYSRWNMLVAMFITCIYFFLLFKISNVKFKMNIMKKIFISMCVLMFIVIMVFDVEKVKFALGADSVERSNSFEHRKTAIVDALDFFSKHPLLGYGPGEIYVRQFTISRYKAAEASEDSGNYVFLSPYEINLEVPHSTFALLLAEGGILTFVSYIMLLLFIITTQFHNLSLKGDLKLIGLGLFTASVAITVLMIFSNFDTRIETSILFWFIMGLGLGLYEIDQQHKHNLMKLKNTNQ